MVIPVACVGRCGGSIWTRVIALDRVEQLGYMLFSRLIHLDHCQLISIKGKNLVTTMLFLSILTTLNLKTHVKNMELNNSNPQICDQPASS